MKTILCKFALFFGMLMLISCQSPEKKVIHRLDRLSERIEKDGKNFDADDWAEALEDLADIHDDLQDCDFNAEQLKEIGKAEGRLAAIIANEGSKAVGREFSNAMKSVGSFMKGFREGAEENLDADAIEEAGDEISNSLKDIEDAFK